MQTQDYGHKHLEAIVNENLSSIHPEDAYLKQFLQAKTIRETIQTAIENGSQTAAEDALTVCIDGKHLSVSLFDADSISIVAAALYDVMQSDIYNLGLPE